MKPDETPSPSGASTGDETDRASQPEPRGAARHTILYEWNDTHAEFPDVCAHELFERQAARTPDATAVVCGDTRLTYRQLNERANQVAHYLRRRGVRPDSLVGVSLHRTPLMPIGLLGVWKAGAAYVPLDPAYPADRLAFMAGDAAVEVLLADTDAKPLFPGIGDRLVCLDSEWALVEPESRENPAAAARPSNLAYVIYTSGSTGRPKGALIVHSGLVNYLCWAITTYGVRAGDSVPVHSSISFDLTVTSLYPALLAGGQVELLPEDVGAQSLVASLRNGTQRGLVKITPAHLEILNQQVDVAEAAGITRAFIIGGENLTAEGLRVWREAAPMTRLINEYGPTETVVGCCVYEVRPDDPDRGSVPIGRPIANTELYVLDEARQPVPVGVMGELYIGGAGVARGYLNRPELTQERFLPDPFSGRAGSRLYRTGDLARYRNDGVLEYLGRVDNQVKVRGYRVELGEVEATLAGQPKVRSCAVLAREDSHGNKLLVGYVVPREREAPVPDEMRRYLMERLPDHMVPAHFVFLDSFPLTENGKVDRKALPAPTYEDASGAADYVAPRTDVEQQLSVIWSKLVELERVGVHDDVLDLGASSLMVISAVMQIQDAFGVVLAMGTVFESPTIAQMAAAIEAARGRGHAEERPPEAAIAATEPPPPVPQPAVADPTTAEPHLVPIRFGPPGRELLGLYQWPSDGQNQGRCCLLCNPFGQAAVRSHRVFRVLADRLARSGLHVLRFDYFGAGDSPGADDEGTLASWVEDILRANDELVRRSGQSRVVWLGLGIGATLAARASRLADRVPAHLVLWDPVTDGPAWLAELAAAHISERRKEFGPRWEAEPWIRTLVAEEAKTEGLGYPVTTTLKAEMGALTPASCRGIRAERVTLVASGANDGVTSLREQLANSGVEVRTLTLESSITWLLNDMLSDSVIPSEDLRRLVEAASE